MPRSAQATHQTVDLKKSVKDWGKEPITSLKLRCNALNLSEVGPKITLQRRLYMHFNPTATTTAQHEEEYQSGKN